MLVKLPCRAIERETWRNSVARSSSNIARKCKIRASKCKDALANSEAQRRNLEPTVCVGTMGPTQTIGAEERDPGWPLSDHFPRRAQRAS